MATVVAERRAGWEPVALDQVDAIVGRPAAPGGEGSPWRARDP